MDIQIRMTDETRFIPRLKAHKEIIDEGLKLGIGDLISYGQATSMKTVGVKTGDLRRSIVGTPVQDVGGVFSAMWGTNKPYAKHHEYGTDPHVIRPKNKKALRWKGANIVGPILPGITGKRRGNVVFARVVRHPGTKGRFYMKAGRDEAIRRMPETKAKILAYIERRLGGA